MRMKVCRYWLGWVGCVVVAGGVHAQHALSAKWISYVGAENFSDAVYAIATDSQTDAYFGGRLGSCGLFNDDGVEISDAFGWANGDDGFVAKVTTNGVLRWATLLSWGNGSAVYGVAVTNGAVYAGGASGNENDYNWNLDTRTDAVLTRLDAATGGVTWSHALGESGGAYRFCTTNGYTAVAVDAGGNVYAVGYTTITNLPSLAGSAYGGGMDAVVAKYSSIGTLLWSRYLGGANGDWAAAVAVGADGSVYVAGQTRSPGWVTLGNSALPSSGNAYGFLAKLNSSGAMVYSTLLGGSGADNISAVLKDAASGTLILAGQTTSADFCQGLAANTRNGPADGFVMGLTDLGASCQTNWFRFVGGNGNQDAVTALAWMANGQVVAGGITGTGGWLAPQGEGALGYQGMTDGFLLQLDKANGAPLWSTYVGAAQDDNVYAVAVGGEAVFVGGDTFSPGFAYGSFCDEWPKENAYGSFPCGFIGRWTQGASLPPDITTDLQDTLVHEGEPAVFTLVAQASPSPTYYWTTNGVPVACASNQYTIAPALPAHDNTLVCCVVSNVFGATTSHVARLTVIANGAITVSLAPQQAIAQGAQWSIDGGVTWLDSGVTLTVHPDDYAVTFTSVAGWVAPAPQAVTVHPGEAVSRPGMYMPILATAARTVVDTNVTLTVQVPAGAASWTLVETLPIGLTPTVYDATGVWNSTTRTLTFTNTIAAAVSYTVAVSPSGIYAVGGSITTSPSGMSAAVTGDTQVVKANIIRAINGTRVTIRMLQPQSAVNWMISDFLPEGLTPVLGSITGPGGGWDDVFAEVYWSGRTVAQTLSYEVTGAPGTYVISGEGFITGFGTEPILGDSVVVIPGPPPPPPDILSFTVHGATGQITFVSVLNQAYMVQTNATLTALNGWHDCLPVTGAGPTTPVTVPTTAPQLFYRMEVR